jgi:hypothetical protein
MLPNNRSQPTAAGAINEPPRPKRQALGDDDRSDNDRNPD